MNQQSDKKKPVKEESGKHSTAADAAADSNADSVVYRGTQAIDAARKTDPDITDEDEKKDAEKWRNEG